MPKAKAKTLHMEAVPLKKAAFYFFAINSEERQRMLRQMHEKGSMTVTEVSIAFNMILQMASFHLSCLGKAKLVLTERKGKYIYYSVNYKQLNNLHALAKQLLPKSNGIKRTSLMP